MKLIFKWAVFQIYTHGYKSIRVVSMTPIEYINHCSEHVEMKEHSYRYFFCLANGDLVVCDFFDAEEEARDFAERCWKQG